MGLLQKILMRLYGTYLCINCTSLAGFASSFLRQPNGPKCTQIVRNTPKHEFKVQWCGSGAFVVKKFLQDIVARIFALITLVWRVLQQVLSCSETVPNAPKKKRNTPKPEFRDQWCGLGALFVKNSDKTSWHELLH